MQYRNNRTNSFSRPYPGRSAAKIPQTKLPSGGNPIARTFVEQVSQRYRKLFDCPILATASRIGSFYSFKMLTGPCTVPQREEKGNFASFRFLLPGYQPVKKPRVDDILLQLLASTMTLATSLQSFRDVGYELTNPRDLACCSHSEEQKAQHGVYQRFVWASMRRFQSRSTLLSMVKLTYLPSLSS